MWFFVDIAWAEPTKVPGATALVEYEAARPPKDRYTLQITPEGAAPIEVVLLDDGQTPDLEAGDKRYVAFTAFDEVQGQLELRDGAELVGRGPFQFDNTAMQRLLRVQPVQGVIYAGTVLAFNPGDVQPPAGAGPSGKAADAAARSDLANATWADTELRSPRPRRLLTGAVAIGAALAALVSAWWLWGGRSGGLRELPDLFAVEGIFGSGPLPPGVHVWGVPDGIRPEVRAAVLTTLARGRRLHVVCPDDTELPRLTRGPHNRGVVAGLDALREDVDTVVVDGAASPSAWRGAAKEGRTVLILAAPDAPGVTAEVVATSGGLSVAPRR